MVIVLYSYSSSGVVILQKVEDFNGRSCGSSHLYFGGSHYRLCEGGVRSCRSLR